MKLNFIGCFLFQILYIQKAESESNLALRKTASQSSVLNGAVAGLAVDGRREPRNGLTEVGCTATDGADRPDNWWMVDLGQPYVVLRLTVFSRNGWNDNLNRFNVRVSNNSNITDHSELCVYHEGPVPGSSNVTLYCERELIGQYVSIQKTTNTPGNGYLFLCEVEVYGYTYTACGPDKYGENCNRDCNCQTACTDILGVCPSQCDPGKKTNRIPGLIGDCTVDCPDYRFGADCVGDCHCEGGVLCDNKTGVCPGKCEDRYGGSNCSVELPKLVNAPEYLTKTSTSIQIRFRQFNKSPGDQGDGPVTDYQVEIHNLNNNNNPWVNKANPWHDNTRTYIELNIPDLEYNTEYSIRIVAVYDDGNERIVGLPSPVLKIKTKCKAPVPPMWLEPTLTGSIVYVKWQLNPGGHGCDSYKKVEVHYMLNVQPKTVYKDHLSDNGTDIAVTLEREYSITLVVYNNEDIKAESGPHKYYTGTVTSSTETMRTSATAVKSTSTRGPGQNTGQQGGGGGGSNAGIIGGVVGGIILVILIVLLAVFFIRRRKKDKGHDSMSPGLMDSPDSMVTRKENRTAIDNPAFVKETEISKELKFRNKGPDGKVKAPAPSRPPPAPTSPPPDQLTPPSSPSSTKPLIKEKPKSLPVKPGVKLVLQNGGAIAAGGAGAEVTPSDDEDELEIEGDHSPQTLRKRPPKENIYSNRPAKKRIIPLASLSKVIVEKKNGQFKEEYKELPIGLTAVCEAGSKPENKVKNRYLNIRAYDHARVVLSKQAGDPFSDYINASYIDGYEKPKAYIATQGPNKETLHDFWRMLWETEANRIVMVTNIVEMTKVKSIQYWPDTDWKEYGDITVTMVDTTKQADMTIRTFTISKKNVETRSLMQYHFTAWPDKGIPKQATALLAFRKKIRGHDNIAKGPMVVHCSAGVGRTGTFIALDYLMDQIQKEDEVDIFSLVHLLRTQRVNMIQTLEQYIFLHQALKEGLHTGDTTIPTPLFREKYTELCEIDPVKGKTKIVTQYENLELLKQLLNVDKAAGTKAENKNKNRDPAIIPVDINRPYMISEEGKQAYINAVYVDGFADKDAFLVTQNPLPHTVADFIRMVYDRKLTTVALLNQSTPKGCQYWPVSGDIKFGPFTVKQLDEDTSNDKYIMRTLDITHEDRGNRVIFKQLLYLGWSEDSPAPASAQNFIDFIEAVMKSHNDVPDKRKGSQGLPVLVQCHNGAKMSGLFCAVANLMEEIKSNQDVDVFRSVRLIRTNRPQFIGSVDQYKFCHEAVIEYLTKFDMYANFQ